MTEPLDPHGAAFLPHDLWIDLGSGLDPEPGFMGIDLEGDVTNVAELAVGRVLRHDLWGGKPWPLPRSSTKLLRASHLIQFIPHTLIPIAEEVAERMISPDPRAREAGKKRVFSSRSFVLTQDAFFWFFDQAWRIAAPGCRFEVTWPEPVAGPLKDPTVRRRIPLTTLQYLSQDGRRQLRATEYRVGCDWHVEAARILVTREIVAILKKPELNAPISPPPANDTAPVTPRLGSPSARDMRDPSVPEGYEDAGDA